MGFIKAFSGAISGTLADQWKDFYVPRNDVTNTTAFVQAVPQSTNNGRGENYKGNENIISNGSKIIVPEGMALVTIQDGQITGFIAEPGGFEFRSDDINSKSCFAGDGIIGQMSQSIWDKVKFGGQPGSQQLAFYVNLKEIAGIRFGTQAPIQWMDSWFDSKVGAMMRGTYSIRIVNPLLFIKQFLPMSYMMPSASPYDFNDINDSTDQLLNELRSSLGAGVTKLSKLAKEAGEDTYNYVSEHRVELAKELTSIVENDHGWTSKRGLIISNITMELEYDEATQELQKEFQQDDKEIRKAKRMAEVYSNNMAGAMAAATGSAMQSAASNENGAMMGFMGMNMAQNTGANVLGTVSNMQPQGSQVSSAPIEDPTEKLLNAKKLLDAGAITQEEYDKLKAQYLGL